MANGFHAYLLGTSRPTETCTGFQLRQKLTVLLATPAFIWNQAVDVNPPSHAVGMRPQEVSVKQLCTPRRWFGQVLIFAVFCGVACANQKLPDGLVLYQTSLNLGNVLVGSNATLYEIVSNPTASDIRIAVSAEGANFQITGASSPLVIAAGREVRIGISFAPTSVGQVTGSLLLSIDGITPDATIPVSGVGVGLGQLTASPASINFGASRQITETLTNSGGTLLTLQTVTTTGTGVVLSGLSLPIALRPNQSLSFNVSAPPSATGNVNGSINFTAWAGWWATNGFGTHEYESKKGTRTYLVIPVSSSTALGQLTPAPSSVSFGSAQVGSTQAQSATLTNSGNGPLTVTQAAATGTGFSISGLPLPMTLNPGDSATFSALFAPQSTGNVKGSISIVSNASNSTLNLALSGSGASSGQLILSPASLNFGSVPIGKNQSMSATLAASGSSVTVSSASANTPEFSLGGIQLPITIPAGKSASFTVTFTPQASGTSSASIAFGSNASPSTSVESVSGAGSAPASHSVGLSWSPGGSNVSGYNVYRGSQSGGPYAKINSAPTAITSYGDGAVNSGQTYFYVTTALDSSGGESTNSNEVQAVIP